ncbi:MAG: tetratricopeptide repeat protein [Alphaproteobacteria bacterium]|nr:tetratricopeptide repeat protein [Alphaproteobacteria bacterium]
MLEVGLQHHQSGRFREAEQIYREVLEADPDEPDANYLLGMLVSQAGDKEAAIERITRSIRVRPGFPPVHNNLGTIYEEVGQQDKAVASYRRAIQLDSNMAEAHNNLGNALKAANDFAAAVRSFRKAIDIRPDFVEAHYNLGVANAEQGQLNEAMAAYRKAIALRPEFAEPYNNLGQAQKMLGRLDEAIANFRRAIAIRPNDMEPHLNLGECYWRKGDLESAIEVLRQAVQLDRKSVPAIAGLLNVMQFACDWSQQSALSQALDRLQEPGLARGTGTEEPPLLNICRVADPARNYEVARSRSQTISRQMQPVAGVSPRRRRRANDDRITIGYLSSDFGEHAVGYLTRGLFALHDRQRFKVLAYAASGSDGSDNAEKVKRDSDGFADLGPLSYAESVRRIRDDKVDILIDLNGHTHGNLLNLCAMRPVPIQVTWLGFPGTSGADFFDYILTDRTVSPEDHAAYYSESFAYLPQCYQMNGLTDDGPAAPIARAELGLPEASVVFCSFVGNQKIEPNVFKSWMRILEATPESVLWLYQSNHVAAANLEREAAAHGIDGARLCFGEKMPRNKHLQRLKCADIALDTWIYGGHTTTSDALRADVPVVARLGTHFASRVSSSILQAMGLETLITHSSAEYEALAIRLAREPAMLRDLKARVSRARETSPLFDTRSFVASLEDVYGQIWQRHRAGEEPCLIEAAAPAEP